MTVTRNLPKTAKLYLCYISPFRVLIRNMLIDYTCMRARSGKTERCFRNRIFSHSFGDLHGKRCEPPVFSIFQLTEPALQPAHVHLYTESKGKDNSNQNQFRFSYQTISIPISRSSRFTELISLSPGTLLWYLEPRLEGKDFFHINSFPLIASPLWNRGFEQLRNGLFSPAGHTLIQGLSRSHLSTI